MTLVACGWCCDRAPAQERQPGAPTCGGEEIARGIGDVSDGRTFALNDGREVRLAAVEVPPIPLPKEIDPPPGGAAARDTLNALIGGDEVVLRQREQPPTGTAALPLTPMRCVTARNSSPKAN